MPEIFRLNSDGASQGNPGHSGAGAVVWDQDNKVVSEVGVYLGRKTNNNAEYMGLILGLKAALGLGVEALSIRMDSELIVRQIQERYKVKNPALATLYSEAKKLLAQFSKWDIDHVYREHNVEADHLASSAASAGAKGLLKPGQDICELTGESQIVTT